VPYPEMLIAPMRGEMLEMGAREARTAQEVDDVVKHSDGVVMMVVNSVCGCAAGKARPGIALALKHEKRPAVVATVFAGADLEATERARSYFTGHAPSSPSIGLLKDGELVYLMERRDIESRTAELIADELRRAFDQHC
jgi:putative YphP/YqiW family bacilliredoxin